MILTPGASIKVAGILLSQDIWMDKHIFKGEENVVYTEPSIMKLKVFAWKVKAPQKIRHLI